MRRLLIPAGGLVGLFAVAPAVLAQTVPGRGYAGVAGEVQEQIGVGQVDFLPFTGLDLALLVGGGLMLLLVGLLVRRSARAGS